ncbi:MAG: hypothetical protein O9256_00030 [Rhizobiaceae bacterium]|jgi:hypothetical protein|nr:hypothetical protein [Rhizobiaceae bacterium]
MHPATQISGVIAGTTITAALASALVGGFGALVLGICDPKFGCTFGLQFGALVAGVFGLLGSIVFICFAAAYTAFSHKTLAPRLTLQLAAAAGVAIGAVLAAAALATYA